MTNYSEQVRIDMHTQEHQRVSGALVHELTFPSSSAIIRVGRPRYALVEHEGLLVRARRGSGDPTKADASEADRVSARCRRGTNAKRGGAFRAAFQVELSFHDRQLYNTCNQPPPQHCRPSKLRAFTAITSSGKTPCVREGQMLGVHMLSS